MDAIRKKMQSMKVDIKARKNFVFVVSIQYMITEIA